MYQYLEEHGGHADLGLFLASSADSTTGVDGRRELTSSCPTDGTWVDCVEGKVRGTDTSCNDACDGACCTGYDYNDACFLTTACIKKDGSCNGQNACGRLGLGSNYQIQVSGPSCTSYYACSKMFRNNPNSGAISLTKSCLCANSCFDYLRGKYHCSYDLSSSTLTPALDDLPACGESFCNIVGRTGFDACESLEACVVSCSLSLSYSPLLGVPI